MFSLFQTFSHFTPAHALDCEIHSNILVYLRRTAILTHSLPTGEDPPSSIPRARSLSLSVSLSLSELSVCCVWVSSAHLRQISQLLHFILSRVVQGVRCENKSSVFKTKKNYIQCEFRVWSSLYFFFRSFGTVRISNNKFLTQPSPRERSRLERIGKEFHLRLVLFFFPSSQARAPLFFFLRWHCEFRACYPSVRVVIENCIVKWHTRNSQAKERFPFKERKMEWWIAEKKLYKSVGARRSVSFSSPLVCRYSFVLPFCTISTSCERGRRERGNSIILIKCSSQKEMRLLVRVKEERESSLALRRWK